MCREHRAYIRTSVLISTQEGDAVTQGVLEGLTAEGAVMALTTPLEAGGRFRITLVGHANPSRRVERLGEVVWTRHSFNPDEELKAECRVRWVDAIEAEEAPASPKTPAAWEAPTSRRESSRR